MTDQGAYGLAALVLTVFGITVPLPAFAGGLIIAVGMCFAVMMVRPLTARRGVLLTLLMGLLAGLIASLVHDATLRVWIWGALPIQAQMGAAGALSQALFELIALRGGLWLGALASKAGVPGPDSSGAGGESR